MFFVAAILKYKNYTESIYRSIYNVIVSGVVTWKRCLTGSESREPVRPVVTTEIPGPRSRSLLHELNAIQVCVKYY